MNGVPTWHGNPSGNGLRNASESSPPRTLPIGETIGYLIVSVNDDGSESYEGLICGHHSDPFNPFTWDATEAARRCLKEGFDDGCDSDGEIFRAYEIASITLTGRRLMEDCDPLLKRPRKRKPIAHQIAEATNELNAAIEANRTAMAAS